MSGFGLTNDQFKEETGFGNQTEIYRMDDYKQYQHRVVYGVKRKETVFIPQQRVGDDGKPYTFKMPVNLKAGTKNTIIDELARVEKSIRGELGEEKPRSAFDRSSMFVYLVFDRDNGNELRVFEYKWSIADDLQKKQNKTNKEGKLMYGMMYGWDAILEKKRRGVNSNPAFDTEYTVDVDPSTIAFPGEMPANAADDSSFNHSEWIQKALTQEEWDRLNDWLQEHPNGLQDTFDVKSNSEVLEMVQENGIFLSYPRLMEVNINGKSESFVEQFVEAAASEIDTSLLLTENNTPQLDAPDEPDAEPETETSEVDQAEEVEHTEVNEETVDEENGW